MNSKSTVPKLNLKSTSTKPCLIDIAKEINKLVVSYYGTIKRDELIRIKVKADGNVIIDVKKDKDYSVNRHIFNTKGPK